MEKQLEEFYQKYKKIGKKGVIRLLVFMAIGIAIVSIFLGNPFPYKVDAVIVTYWAQGWILANGYIFYIILLISFVCALIWEGRYLLQLVNRFRNILYEECDAQGLLEIAELGISFIPEKVYRTSQKANRAHRAIRVYFERYYIEALNAKGEYEQAQHYLEYEWKSKKGKGYQQLLQNICLNIAYKERNLDKYMEIHGNAVPAIKKSMLLQSQMKSLEKDYQEALNILNGLQPKFLYEKVNVSFKTVECLCELGRYEEAKAHIQFVIENGNTVILKQRAEVLNAKMQGE